MSLFDVDINSEDRTNPEPNGDDVISGSRMAHNTVSTNYTPTGQNPQGARVYQRNGSIVANDGTANKALFGYNPGLGKWGSFVAQDGTDVTTNTDPSKLIFNSSQDVFKIVNTITVTFPTASVAYNNNSNYAIATTTIPHGLSFIPVVSGIINALGQYIPLPYTSVLALPTVGAAAGGISSVTYRAYADATNIYVETQATASSTSSGTYAPGNLPGKIYILQETAN